MKNLLCLILLLPVVCFGQGYIGQGYTGASGGDTSLGSVIMPDTMAVAVDREMNIWNNAIGLQFPSISYFGFVTFSDVGGVHSRSYRYTPTTASSDGLEIKIQDPGMKETGSTDVILEAVLKTGGARTAESNVLFIGDSLMYAGEVVAVVDSLFDADGGGTVAMVGTQTDTVNGIIVNHEGKGGWLYRYFATDTVDNPFWISGKLDFQQYCTDNSIAGGIDYVVINLGINDSNNWVDPTREWTAAEIETYCIDHAKNLVDAILDPTDGYPSCKVIIGIEPTGAWDPTVYSYSGEGWNFRYYSMLSLQKINKRLLDVFDGGSYGTQVDVCFDGLWVDRTYGYQVATVAESARSATTKLVITDRVHPSYIGYQQIADSFYSHLRWWMAKASPPVLNELTDSFSIDGTTDCWTASSSVFTITPDQAGAVGNDAVLVVNADGGDAWVGAVSEHIDIVGDDVTVSSIVKFHQRSDGWIYQIALYDHDDSAEYKVGLEWNLGGSGVATIIGSGVNDGQGLDDLGSGWYRIWMTVDLATAGASGHEFSFRTFPWGNGTGAGDGVYLDGAQVEVGVTSPTDYYPTYCE